MSEKIDLTTNNAYEEGYIVGNAGMPSSYLPFKYQKDNESSQQWQKGWKDGAKNAGIHHSSKTKKIITGFLIIAILLFITYYLVNFLPSPDNLSKNKNASVELTTPAFINTERNSTLTLKTLSDNDKNTTLNITTQIPIDQTTLQTEITSTLSSIDNQEEESNTTVNHTTNSFTKASIKQEELYTSGFIDHAVFSKNIIKRNPVEVLIDKTPYIDKIFFFTKLENALGKTITHAWYYEGQLVSKKTFKEIQGNTWRLYSQQNILPQQLGRWTVNVTDAKNNLLAQNNIIIE